MSFRPGRTVPPIWQKPFEATGSGGGAALAPGLPCFGLGTRLATPQGLRPVEALVPGDLVLTRDNGYCPVWRVGTLRLERDALVANAGLRAVTVEPGAQGPGRPGVALTLPAAQRVLVADEGNAWYFGEREVLVSLHDLIDGAQWRKSPPSDVTYVQIQFERHEIVLAEGLWCASFLPDTVGAAAARKTLHRHEAMLLR